MSVFSLAECFIYLSRISSNVVFHQVEFTTTINADLLRKLAIILYNFYKNVNAYLPGMRFKSIPHLQYSNVSGKCKLLILLLILFKLSLSVKSGD